MYILFRATLNVVKSVENVLKISNSIHINYICCKIIYCNYKKLTVKYSTNIFGHLPNKYMDLKFCNIPVISVF